jgi:hypothetical protein
MHGTGFVGQPEAKIPLGDKDADEVTTLNII